MVLTPNDLFSWNNRYNKYAEYTIIYTSTHLDLSLHTLLTLCMLASRSRGEVVFLSLLSSSHFVTTCNVLPLPLSGLNWPSLSLPRGSFPPPPKMASLFTGSAHPPLPEHFVAFTLFLGSLPVNLGRSNNIVISKWRFLLEHFVAFLFTKIYFLHIYN